MPSLEFITPLAIAGMFCFGLLDLVKRYGMQQDLVQKTQFPLSLGYRFSLGLFMFCVLWKHGMPRLGSTESFYLMLFAGVAVYQLFRPARRLT